MLQKPDVAFIDGIPLHKFKAGQQYEVGSMLGALFLCEGWAEPIDDPEPTLVIPLREMNPDAENSPSNLTRDTFPPYFDHVAPIALAADRRLRKRRPAS
jgi:hypothetical protein